MTDSRFMSPWEYPDCPDCDAHIFVDRYQGCPEDYWCYHCQTAFNG